MCKFCDQLYSSAEACEKLHNEGAADLVYYSPDGLLSIQVDTGDPWQSGDLDNITFCPYCGRNLKELYRPFIRGVTKENKDVRS